MKKIEFFLKKLRFVKKTFHAALSTTELQCLSINLNISIPIFTRVKILEAIKNFLENFTIMRNRKQ